MGYRIIILMLFCANCFAQNNIQFKTQIQRCLIGGVPVENCFAVSDAQGKFNVTTVEDVNQLLQSANAGAVDSIYVNNDTLYVDYNGSTPTLSYYAPGLNGIFGATNNNKLIKVGTSWLPVSGGGWNLQTQTGLARVAFNHLFNVPISMYAQASQGYLSYGFPNASNRALHATLASGQQYNFGSMGTSWQVRDHTALGLPRLSINAWTSGIDTTVVIRGNGDIKLSGYNGGRVNNNNFLNIAWCDANGVLQLASKQSLIDTINANISSGGFFTSSTASGHAEQDANGYGLYIDNLQELQISVPNLAGGSIGLRSGDYGNAWSWVEINNEASVIGATDNSTFKNNYLATSIQEGSEGVSMHSDFDTVSLVSVVGEYKIGTNGTGTPTYTSDPLSYLSLDTITNKLYTYQVPYKKYVALFTTSGGNIDPPLITVLENTVGNIVWAYNGDGNYVGTLAGAFPALKTWYTITNITGQCNDERYVFVRSGDDTMTIQTMYGNCTYTDGLMQRTPIEIRVYN
jgi:hypothetical protein